MENNLIKINKTDLTSTSEYSTTVQEQNKRIAELRKEHLFNSLKEVTQLRINTAHNIEKWISILSDKIFSPENIEKIDINKAILLFKYVNNINLKVLADSNRLEEILGKYLQSGAMDAQMKMNENENQSDREKLKSEIMSKLNQMFKQNIDEHTVDAEFTKREETSDEDLKLVESVENEIESNFSELTSDIKTESDNIDELINQSDEKLELINQSDDDIDDDELIELDDDF